MVFCRHIELDNESSLLTKEGDASEKGIGFALMQQGQPVTYASRALTKAEQNYSQIEKELLAQVFGMKHNHQHVYGRRVTLMKDHKPLEIIVKKPLCCCSKTFTLSYDEANAVWCRDQVQAWPWDVSCWYTFQSIPTTWTSSRKGRSGSRKNPFCKFLVSIRATDPRNPRGDCQRCYCAISKSGDSEWMA